MGSLQNEIQALAPWSYDICLPDGISTLPKGHQDARKEQWQHLRNILPGDLTGMKVLEIGCSNGFHAIELAKRGAKVLVIDSDQHCIRQAEWIVSQYHFQNKIWIANMHPYDLPQLNMQFDIVLYLGAFHSLRYTRLALHVACQKAADTFIFANPYIALKGIKPLLMKSQFSIIKHFDKKIYLAERYAVIQPATNALIQNEISFAETQKRYKGRRKLKNRATQGYNRIK